MTDSPHSQTIFLSLFLSVLLAVAGNALAARGIRKEHDNKKQLDCFGDQSDGSLLIPGVGRILVPMPGTVVGSTPFPGGDDTFTPPAGGSSSLPGGDDTFPPPAGGSVPVPGGDRTFSPPVIGSSPLPGGDDTFPPVVLSPTNEVPTPLKESNP